MGDGEPRRAGLDARKRSIRRGHRRASLPARQAPRRQIVRTTRGPGGSADVCKRTSTDTVSRRHVRHGSCVTRRATRIIHHRLSAGAGDEAGLGRLDRRPSRRSLLAGPCVRADEGAHHLGVSRDMSVGCRPRLDVVTVSARGRSIAYRRGRGTQWRPWSSNRHCTPEMPSDGRGSRC